ncbi:MAG: acetolactate synthase [Nitrospirae bacterium]|nr:acetolactate synthase [Nitrospirota bacterium]
MGSIHGGLIVAKALKSIGTECLFTLCGGHIQNIYDGCLTLGIRVVDFRHEQAAAHAADGWSRATGKPGVVAVTAGPGVTDAVTGVANAWRAQSPMIVIGGQGPKSMQDKGSLQEMDHVELMRSITKWSVSVPETRRLGEYVLHAYRVALSGVPGPVFLEMPIDILMNYAEEAETGIPDRPPEVPPMGPDPAQVERAAELIRTAQNPVALIGSQLAWSRRRDIAPEFCETLHIPAFLNGMARGALRPDHPWFFHLCRRQALEKADVVLVFGTPLDFRLDYGRVLGEKAKIVQVDLEGKELGRNRPLDLAILGDTGLVMDGLLRTLGSRKDGAPNHGWIEYLRQAETKAWEKMKPEMESNDVPVNPLRFSNELRKFVDENTVLIGDGGDIVGTAAKMNFPYKMGQWMDPGPLGTLGVGPSFAMAAKLANPEARVMIVYGDGSFGLNGFEYEAAIRQKIPFVGVMGNDAAWMQIHRGQEMIFGADRTVATKLDFTRYDRIVEAMGGHGEYVEKPAGIGPAIERSLASGKPALVNVKIGRSEFRRGSLSV